MSCLVYTWKNVVYRYVYMDTTYKFNGNEPQFYLIIIEKDRIYYGGIGAKCLPSSIL